MIRRIAIVVALAGLLATACGETWTTLDDVDCPPEGSELTYDNYARGFLSVYCNDCHAAGAEDRKGAPQAYVFDTYDQAFALRERIFVRSAGDNTSMPPGPEDPSQEARDMLAEWVACGAPEL